jgi:hypothetical protein
MSRETSTICGSSHLTRVFPSAISSEPLRKNCAFGRKRFQDWKIASSRKETRLKSLWSSRLGHQMEALPQYDEVFRTMRRELRQAAFPK